MGYSEESWEVKATMFHCQQSKHRCLIISLYDGNQNQRATEFTIKNFFTQEFWDLTQHVRFFFHHKVQAKWIWSQKLYSEYIIHITFLAVCRRLQNSRGEIGERRPRYQQLLVLISAHYQGFFLFHQLLRYIQNYFLFIQLYSDQTYSNTSTREFSWQTTTGKLQTATGHEFQSRSGTSLFLIFSCTAIYIKCMANKNSQIFVHPSGLCM